MAAARERRGFLLAGERCLLVDDPEVRKQDLADHTITVHRESDG